MSRVQELTLQLFDDALADAEQTELSRILQSDSVARREHLLLAQLEAVLRAERPIDFTIETMSRIRQIADDQTQQSVLNKIKSRSSPAWKRIAGSGRRKAVSAKSPAPGASARLSARRSIRARRSAFSPALLIAASIALVAGLALLYMQSQHSTPAAETLATLESAPAGTVLLRESHTIKVASGSTVVANDTLTAGATAATVRYSDGTVLTLETGASLAFSTPDEFAAKPLGLNSGTLRASVAKQDPERPLVIHTRHASATVLGTQFSLMATADSTKLTVDEGQVGLRRSSDGKGVLVAAGEFAVAAEGQVLVAQRVGSPAVAQTPVIAPQPAPAKGEISIAGFHLVNADTGAMIPGFSPIAEGAVINLKKLPKISLVVITDPPVIGSIIFDVDGKKKARVETSAPYAITPNWDGNRYMPWSPAAGSHSITATPHAEKNGNGKAGRAMTLNFTVTR